MIVDLFRRMAKESQWKKDFMTEVIRAGMSFNSAERLACSKRALCLRDAGLSASDAWENFEEKGVTDDDAI